MTTLEEAILKTNLTQKQNEEVENTLKPLIPQLDTIQNQIDRLKSRFLNQIKPEQYTIIDDIVDYNEQLLKKNQLELHEVIKKDSELKWNIQNEINKAQANNKPNGEMYQTVVQKIDSTHLLYIQKLENLEFKSIGEIKKVDKVCSPSFNKIWIWVLEVFYGMTSAKYFWEDFSRKAFLEKNDYGQELRRRMIIFEVKNMSIFQFKDLETILESDIPLLKDKMTLNQSLTGFFEILSLLSKLYKLEQRRIKEKSEKVHADIIIMKEDKLSALKTMSRLNSTKFETISDVQNIYALIDSEFK